MKKYAFKIAILLFSVCFAVIGCWIPVQASESESASDEELTDMFEREWDGGTDPWAILRDSEMDYIGSADLTVSIANIIKYTIVTMCLLGSLICVITIPFISKAENLKNKKEDITHKLLVLAGTLMVIPALGFIKWLLDNQFGMM